VPASSAQKPHTGLLTLPRLVADPPLEGTRIAGVSISPDARWLTFLRGSEADSEVLDLWGLPLGESEATPRVLVRATDILPGGVEKLSDEERMARERKRIRLRGLVQYSFCGEEGHALLFSMAGDLYHVVPQPTPKVKRLTHDGGAKLDPTCSPRAGYVSYVRAGELHAIDLATGSDKQLTRGATATRQFGVAEFVAQEEMDRHRGYWWSRDDRFLAYTEVDLSPVSVKMRPRIHADRTDIIEQRYPAAGEANARVHVHVRDTKSGEEVRLTLPTEDGYLARVDWFGQHDLYVQWQSRDQKRLLLLRGSAPAFALEKVLEESDNAWVSLHNDLHVLPDGSLLWPSEADGVRQLYRVTRAGERTPLTGGPDPVTNVAAVDEEAGLVFYQRATARGRERHLFSMPVDGGQERRLTGEPGTHAIRGHRHGRAFVDLYSDLRTPWATRVLDPEGRVMVTLDSGQDAPWRKLALPSAEWVTVPAEDGAPLNGLLVPPLFRQPGKRYPVVVQVYGGPGVQIVTDSFGVLSPLSVYLTQQGFGIFMLDNRGTPGRERAFSRILYKRVADIEVRDQLAGAAYLQKVPWVDEKRIGVFGWSYGGTMSALLITADKTPFAAAVSGAPVTDWRLYDTHYTERYLGKPAENPEAYQRADVVKRAEHLSRPLLIVHGTADDNVLFENTLRLLQALQEKSVPFQLMIYPGHAHGLEGRPSRLHFLRTLVRFFARELDGTVDPASL
jgi:dipeptidyl-peptidase-4